MFDLSRDQDTALQAVLRWYTKGKEAKQFITLGGYAGTGKSTLIAIIRKELHRYDPKLKVGFVSYTGKAARVLRVKLKEQEALYPKDSVSTIHSLIYSPIENDRHEIVGWAPKESIDKSLIIVDEASMVDGSIWNNLLSYRIPILVVGDHGQLPPISGSFNLMSDPEYRLEEIHRQAKDNPIIALSIQARTKGVIDFGTYASGVRKYALQEYDGQEAIEQLLSSRSDDALILCGYNRTRVKLNGHIRNTRMFESPTPEKGDRVICLRNNHEKHIFNGMLGTIETIEKDNEDWYAAKIAMDDEEKLYTGLISVQQFNAVGGLNFTEKRSTTLRGDLFDFGYALTVHKAQGSQAKRVILFEERFSKMDESEWRKWLYTAVTRAEEELYIFSR